MKYATFSLGGEARWGRVDGDRVTLLNSHYPSLKAAIEAGALASDRLRRAAGTMVALGDICFLPLLPDPGKILCVGLNYENHRKETGRAVVANPTIFSRFADSQTAHLAPIVRPPESTQLDYEGELAIVIGKGGRRITAASAMDRIAGYSCYNDGSVRDWQAHSIQFIPGKNFPRTGAFGPWLVTPDAFGEPRDPQVFMKPGDTIEIEIDGIGILENSIADEVAKGE